MPFGVTRRRATIEEMHRSFIPGKLKENMKQLEIRISLVQSVKDSITNDEILNMSYDLNEVCATLEALKWDVTYKMELDGEQVKIEENL